MKLYDQDYAIHEAINALGGNFSLHIPKSNQHYALKNKFWTGAAWIKFRPRCGNVEIFLTGDFSACDNKLDTISTGKYWDDNKTTWRHKLPVDKFSEALDIFKSFEEFTDYD